jgi:glucan phosphoethanolaminetransferase (alkaline phosphatase superfamily)
MSLRRILRIALSLLIIILLWIRTAREWYERPALWLAGSLALSVILLLVVIMEVTGAQRKWRKQKDEVPKRPLGLDT